MHSPLITRPRATRLAGVIVAVALCAGVGGLTAMSASAATVAPSAPTNVDAQNYDGVSVYVSWDATTVGDGSDDADSFTISLDDGVPADFTSISLLSNSDDGPTTSTSFMSVNPGTYAVTVTAVNTFGSAASDPLSFQMDANSSVPSAPLNVAAHNAGDGIVSITWDAPVSDGASPVVEYLASITFPDSADPSSGYPYGLYNGQIIGASDREYTFRDLPFDHGDFIVTVNAINSEDSGNGYQASTAPATLVRSTVPSAPTQLSASSTTANTVTVTWAAPSADGGFAVTDYMVTMGQDFGTFTDGDGRSATFTSVPAGSHTVSVTAFNVNGMSVEASAQVTVLNPVVTPPVVTPPVVTPPVVAPVATAPSAPRTVTDVVTRGGKAAVSFKAPASTHGAITRYIVTLAGQEKWVSATTRTVSFKGLTKGAYVAKVYATTKAGRSKAASVSVRVSAAKGASAPLTLKLGMRGTDIVKLQAKLSMPSTAQSGLFNAGTRTAVLKWQKKHHKSTTGVVNAAMRTSLGI